MLERLGKFETLYLIYTNGIGDEDWRITCVDPVESLEKAILASTEYHQDKEIAIIPEGPYVIPKFSLL